MLPAFLIPALLGGGVGALTNKKDPLKGALMGGALGGVGGAFAPGLLGAGSGSQAGMLAAQEAGLGQLGTMGWGGATTGVQGALNSAGGLLGTAEKLAKPVGTAMQVAGQFQGDNQLPPPPQIVPPTASPTLGQIVQSNVQSPLEQLQEEQMKRNMRQKRIGLMGGY